MMKSILVALMLSISVPVMAQECTSVTEITEQGADAGYTVSTELKGTALKTFVSASAEVNGMEDADAAVADFLNKVDTIAFYSKAGEDQMVLFLFKDGCAIQQTVIDNNTYTIIMKKVEQKASQ